MQQQWGFRIGRRTQSFSTTTATTNASTETASCDSTTTTGSSSTSTSTPPEHHQQQQQQPAVFGGRTRNTRRRDTTGRRHFPERALSARAFPSALSRDRFAATATTAGAYNNKSPAPTPIAARCSASARHYRRTLPASRDPNHPHGRPSLQPHRPIIRPRAPATSLRSPLESSSRLRRRRRRCVVQGVAMGGMAMRLYGCNIPYIYII